MRPCRTALLLLAAAAVVGAPVAAQAKDKEPPSTGPVVSQADDDAEAVGGTEQHGRKRDHTTADAEGDAGGPAGDGAASGNAGSGPGQPASANRAPDFAAVPTIDPRLAAAARDAFARSPQASLHVLVLGRNPAVAIGKAGGAPGARAGSIAGATIPVKDLIELASVHGVAYVMLDLPVLPTAYADASMTPMPFTSLVGAPGAWRRGLSGKGVGIAVIDSGVTRTADFPGRRLVQVRLPGRAGGLDDTYGHGTFVATIAAGSNAPFRGVAPGASVYSIDVDRGDGVYTSDVLGALQWVLANHARYRIRVVNLSLSESEPSSYRVNLLDTLVEQLWRAGIVVVASAGNLGPGSALFAPGNDPFAITVGALDTDGRPAAFSSSGTTADGFAKPELLAPGRHIASALPAGTTLASRAPAANVVAPGYAMMSGTSMSAPQVAGAAAILLQEHPRWTPDQVKSVLVRTARPLAVGPAGSLDLARAAAFAGRPAAANTTAAPATFGLRPSTQKLRRMRDAEMPDGSPTFDAGTWTAGTWTAGTWTAGTWTAGTWTSATWG